MSRLGIWSVKRRLVLDFAPSNVAQGYIVVFRNVWLPNIHTYFPKRMIFRFHQPFSRSRILASGKKSQVSLKLDHACEFSVQRSRCFVDGEAKQGWAECIRGPKYVRDGSRAVLVRHDRCPCSPCASHQGRKQL